MNKAIVLGIILGMATLVGSTYTVATESKAAVANQATATFSIEKMTCKMCDITIRKAMEKVDGVVKAKVDYATKTANVVYNPSKTNVKTIALASTNAGYPATVQ